MQIPDLKNEVNDMKCVGGVLWLHRAFIQIMAFESVLVALSWCWSWCPSHWETSILGLWIEIDHKSPTNSKSLHVFSHVKRVQLPTKWCGKTSYLLRSSWKTSFIMKTLKTIFESNICLGSNISSDNQTNAKVFKYGMVEYIRLPRPVSKRTSSFFLNRLQSEVTGWMHFWSWEYTIYKVCPMKKRTKGLTASTLWTLWETKFCPEILGVFLTSVKNAWRHVHPVITLTPQHVEIFLGESCLRSILSGQSVSGIYHFSVLKGSS